MNCKTCCDQLDLYVLDGLDLAARVAIEEHLDCCADCRSKADAAAELLGGFAVLAESAGGGERLFRRVSCEVRAGRRREQYKRLVLAVGRVAAVFVVGTLSVRLVTWRPPREETDAAEPFAWKHGGIDRIHGGDVTYPIVGGDTVLAVEGEAVCKRLVALDRRTGRTTWRTPFSVAGCATVADSGRAFAWRESMDRTRSLVALDVASGDILWERNAASLPGGRTDGRLVAAAGSVCWTSGGRVTAVSAGTGKPSWSRCLDSGTCLSAPVTDGDAVYIASGRALYALSAATGQIRWETAHRQAGSLFTAPLLRRDGAMLVLAQRRYATSSRLACHDAGTGVLRWEQEVGTPIYSLTVTGDVYLRSTGVCAFSGHTGEPVWSTSVTGCGPLAVARGKLFAVEGRDSPRVLALDPRTGRRLWSRSVGSSCSGLVIAGDTGYLGTRDGALYALRMERRG